MKRIIVSIISAQTIPNFIFIKEMFSIGDKLLFISSKKMEEKIEHITKTLNYINCPINSIVFSKDNDEESWQAMTNQIENKLSKDVCYIVNLTGGTKYMSLAIQNVFKKYNSSFFYIPFPKNYILSFEDNIDKTKLIKYRVGVKEYMSLYNLDVVLKKTTQSYEYASHFFDLFVNGKFSQDEYSIIDKLRAYRDKNITISKVENLEEETDKRPRIDNLEAFIKKIEFPNKSGKLSKYELQYITGGWFEEYVYYFIKEKLTPDDLKIGVEIQRTTNTNMNDLDVVFTLGNKLFVIECKTGIGKKSLFNEIIYKGTALKEYLLGLSANSYLFSLTDEDEDLTQTASNMGISYIDRTYFLDEDKSNELIAQIKKIAY